MTIKIENQQELQLENPSNNTELETPTEQKQLPTRSEEECEIEMVREGLDFWYLIVPGYALALPALLFSIGKSNEIKQPQYQTHTNPNIKIVSPLKNHVKKTIGGPYSIIRRKGSI